MNTSTLRFAFKDTMPILAGYLFLGAGFGILMQQNSYGLFAVLAMSVFIYAGSMQYAAVGLLTSGVGVLTAALTTFLINARHIFYGISMIDAYKGAGKKKPYMIFALTDETFSLVSKKNVPDGVHYHSYCFLVSAFDHCYWILGSILGFLAGSLIPINFEGIDFALTALFVAIFTEQWMSTKNHLPAIIGVAATAICLALFGSEMFLIPSMIVIATTLMIMRKTGRERVND